MRPSPPQAPLPRGPAHAGPAEEARPAAAGPDAGRRRVDSSGRRSAAVQTLLGTVARTLLDDEEVVDHSTTANQGRAEGTSEQVPLGAPPRAAAAAQSPPRPRRTARSAAKTTAESSSRDVGEAAPDRNLWSADVTGVQGPWTIEQAESKVSVAGRVARVRAAPGRVEGVGTGSSLRRGAWGAVLAAVAAIALLTVAGGFDRFSGKPEGEGDAKAQGRDR